MAIIRALAGFRSAYSRVAAFVLSSDWSQDYTAYRGGASRAAALWTLARKVIPRGEGHRLNQALMDLGALLCVARTPRCAACPLRRSCALRRAPERAAPVSSPRRGAASTASRRRIPRR